ncbi:uncharacterized protein LOC135399685 [Ornithodoros turicata]|uniref:uncharacterized protein LOC135399685 n=1 Tax=Ornithodoros turicata TaxID=34597 RepID=UPI0031390EC3
MMGSCVALWGIMVLLLFQGVTSAATGWQQLNIEALIDDFVKAAAGRNSVLWWDIAAQQDVLKSNPHFRNRKVTVSTGPIVYGNETTVSMKPPGHHVHWIHNDRYNESHTSVIKKTFTNTKSYTWSMAQTFTLSHTVKVTVGLPEAVSVESATTASLRLQHGSSETKSDISKVEVSETVTVKPRRSMKLIWTVNNVVKDIPWTMNVTLHGWIAVWYYNKVSKHHLWFYPIDFIAGEGLQHIPGGGIQFTAKGKFTNVNSQVSSVRLEDHDLRAYSSKPLSVTYQPVNATRIGAVESEQFEAHRRKTAGSHIRTLKKARMLVGTVKQSIEGIS